jgi:hypothetical protein
LGNEGKRRRGEEAGRGKVETRLGGGGFKKLGEGLPIDGFLSVNLSKVLIAINQEFIFMT